MGIRSEKRKVLQQIVNKEDSSLDIDPESLMTTGDLHWFDAVSKKPATEKKEEDTTPDKSNHPPLRE
jgi:hypothetical protein